MTIKCAIYTRKSTEHGLEQEFNSLQNQEESCKAYIASQSFNGWQYYKTYSDAAISGGAMERPALKQMLDDMAHGLVNVTDNNHLILKAFATAWKYRELYERDGGVDDIIRNMHTSPRQFYRYLDIAYMNPDKVNEILSWKLKNNVNDLFQIAKENQLNV